ncbi:hypothetical protein CSPX01_11012 [Colletotrichum filicis]|nr:hypothetical protein CSPX01_11012 [Colletotrichum filicis]
MSCYTLDSCPFSVTALGALDARSLDTNLWMPDRSPIPKKLAALDSVASTPEKAEFPFSRRIRANAV